MQTFLVCDLKYGRTFNGLALVAAENIIYEGIYAEWRETHVPFIDFQRVPLKSAFRFLSGFETVKKKIEKRPRMSYKKTCIQIFIHQSEETLIKNDRLFIYLLSSCRSSKEAYLDYRIKKRRKNQMRRAITKMGNRILIDLDHLYLTSN